MVLLSAEQIIQTELLRTERNSWRVPVPELGLVVQGVAVDGGLVLWILGLDLDRHGVGGLGGQGDLWGLRGSVDNELVGNLEEKVN